MVKEMRNQTNQAKLTPLCAPMLFKNVAPRSGSPGITITLDFTQYAHMRFMSKDLRAALFKSFQVLTGFTELLRAIAQFVTGTQVNIYVKAALPGRRQT